MVSEAEWEEIALEALTEHGWEPLPGIQIAPGADDGRTSWDDIVLPGRLIRAMRRLNPLVPGGYIEQAAAEILTPNSRTLSPRTSASTRSSSTATAASPT